MSIFTGIKQKGFNFILDSNQPTGTRQCGYRRDSLPGQLCVRTIFLSYSSKHFSWTQLCEGAWMLPCLPCTPWPLGSVRPQKNRLILHSVRWKHFSFSSVKQVSKRTFHCNYPLFVKKFVLPFLDPVRKALTIMWREFLALLLSDFDARAHQQWLTCKMSIFSFLCCIACVEWFRVNCNFQIATLLLLKTCKFI